MRAYLVQAAVVVLCCQEYLRCLEGFSQKVKELNLLLICKIWTITVFTNREQIRLLNSKSIDLDWYYSRYYWNLK